MISSAYPPPQGHLFNTEPSQVSDDSAVPIETISVRCKKCYNNNAIAAAPASVPKNSSRGPLRPLLLLLLPTAKAACAQVLGICES